jgi:hypothetical protein
MPSAPKYQRDDDIGRLGLVQFPSRSVSWMHCVEAWNLSVAVSAGKASGLRQRIIGHRRKLIGRPDRKKAG